MAKNIMVLNFTFILLRLKFFQGSKLSILKYKYLKWSKKTLKKANKQFLKQSFKIQKQIKIQMIILKINA